LAWEEQLNIAAKATGTKHTFPAALIVLTTQAMLLAPFYPRELTAEALRAQSLK
jgi:hypothetical protein